MPELVADNTHIDPPGTYETGYHLTDPASYGKLLEALLRYAKVHVVGKIDAEVAYLLSSIRNADQAVRMRKGQGIQDYGIEQTEDCRIGADSDAEN